MGNSDTSFDAMEKTVNTPSLLQISGSSVEQEQAARQHRVVDVLSEAASRLRSATLSLAATRAQLDAFTKVKEMKKIQDMTGQRAMAKEDLVVAKGDFKETMEELSELDKTMGGLVNSCKYILDNFDARQAARAAEMDALREAKAILSGMK